MIPTTCQSPAACNGRPIARFGKTWLCRACLDYANQHDHLPTENTMSETEQQIIDYLRTHGRSHTSAIAAALDLNPNTVAGTLSRLRRTGAVATPTGDGCAALTTPTTTPDVVQTSDVDILRAENARLIEESLRTWNRLQALEAALVTYGIDPTPEGIAARMKIAAGMEAENYALAADNARLSAGILVTIEWTPWGQGEGELGLCTRLTIRIGGFSRYIAQIVHYEGFRATVDYSDTRDTLIVITGATLAAVTRPLMALLTDAGVAAPPIPERA